MSVSCDVLIDDARWSGRMDVEALVNSVVDKTLQVTRARLSREAEASFTFADDRRIRELNEIWRKKDAATNVLSFPATDSASLATSPLLGDVVLAYETIERESIDEGKLFEHHAAHMIAHGFLHLIGFDHEDDAQADEMEGVESKVLCGLGMPDPWAGQDIEAGKAEQ